jgi:16S rRNA (cytidine1402-2'-O)-methyltransferase
MLYIVSTPIGNLEDISLRAVRILGQADLILTEDTRKTGLFLKRLAIPYRPMLSFFEHNEERRIPKVIEQLKQDKNIVLISTAGTPLVSDPGFKLVRECIKEEVSFTCLPGPSAVISALVFSGLPPDSFIFLGFLPRKKGKQAARFKEVREIRSTIILFENSQRIKKTLTEAQKILGSRKACVIREMTKKFEEVLRGDITGLLKDQRLEALKGECTVVIEGKVS